MHTCWLRSGLLTWFNGLQALIALGRVNAAVALGAHQLVIAGGKRLLHQRLVALDAEEAFAVPVAFLVRKILQGTWKERMFGLVRNEITF